MKKHTNPVKGPGMTAGISGLKKSSPLLITLAVAVTLMMTAPAVFTEYGDDYDDSAYMVLGSGVTGPGYEYRELETSGSNEYRLAYSLIEGTDSCRVVGWDNDYSEPAGHLSIPATISVDGASKDVTFIGDDAFYGCTGLTSVTIPGSVSSIGEGAFYGCTGLTSVTISNGVASIKGSAFSGCTGLTSVTIPGSVTSIAESAFSGCTGLTSISVDPNNAKYSSEGGVLYDKNKTTLIQCPAVKTGVFTIQSGVTSIGGSAFSGCTGLTSVTIPDSVTSIETFAFYGCTGLTSVTIPDSVTSIGGSAFSGCTGLTSVTIPGSVTSIETFAFSGCTGLTSVTIPGSVTSIGDSAFYECGLTSVTIPGSVTSIGGSAFERCTGLPSVTIPGSVTSIGIYTFRECTSLSIIVFDGTPTTFGVNSFSLGTESKPVTCTVYSLMDEGFLDSYKDSYTTFSYETILQMTEGEILQSVEDGIIELDLEDSEGIRISVEMFENILNVMTNDPSIESVSVSVPGGSVSLDRAALEALLGSLTGSVSVTISEVNASGLSQVIQDAVGDRPVFSVSIGGISSFGDGSLTVSLKYDLRSDEDPNNLIVWFVNDGGTVEEYECTYENGYVTFVTSHLSYYSVMYSVADGGAGGFPTVYVAIIIVAVIIIAFAAVLFIKKKGSQKE